MPKEINSKKLFSGPNGKITSKQSQQNWSHIFLSIFEGDIAFQRLVKNLPIFNRKINRKSKEKTIRKSLKSWQRVPLVSDWGRNVFFLFKHRKQRSWVTGSGKLTGGDLWRLGRGRGVEEEAERLRERWCSPSASSRSTAVTAPDYYPTIWAKFSLFDWHCIMASI